MDWKEEAQQHLESMSEEEVVPFGVVVVVFFILCYISIRILFALHDYLLFIRIKLELAF
jgi:hypothetical protein